MQKYRFTPRTRLDDLETSPFKKYSDADLTVNEYMLRNMCLAYSILKSIVSSKLNYFDEFEQYAVEHPDLAEKLYITLRNHMSTPEKNHMIIYNDLQSIISFKMNTMAHLTPLMSVLSLDEYSSDDSYEYDHLM